MSYILDAIKKSEAERNQGLAPGALAVAGPNFANRTSPALIALIVALNIAAVGTWFWWQSQPSPVSVPLTRGTEAQISNVQSGPASPVEPASSVPTDRPVNPARTATSRPAPTTAIPREPETAPDQIIAPAIASRPSPVPRAPATADPLRIEPGTQASLSVIPEFSTHVFADDAAFRSVTLNGRRLREGDLIEPGMRLLTITETGVVIDYRGEPIEVDVLQDWRD